MLKNIILATLLSVGASAASAFSITPISADCGTPAPTPVGVNCASPATSDPAKVNLGAPDGLYHELGLNGSATFQITPNFTGPATAVEVTFVGANRWQEAAEVLVSKDGIVFQSVATLVNIGSTTQMLRPLDFTFSGVFSFIRFTDVTATIFPNTASTTGFDLDSLSVSQVPLPAGGLLLLGGLGGFALLRRKKNAANAAAAA